MYVVGELTENRDGAASPIQLVDYVDTHAELYELPQKASIRYNAVNDQPLITINQMVKPEMYSKAIQTSTGTSTSTSDLEDSDSSQSGTDEPVSVKRRKKREKGGIGRETEEEMRTRILAELEAEKEKVEKELKELEAEDSAITAIGMSTTQ